MLKKFQVPYEKQLESLMRFDFNTQRIRDAKDGTVIQDLYYFDYEDLVNGLPIEQYTSRACLIRLEKKDGTVSRQAYQVT